ncbi:hypothetical protein HMPREF1981_00576 [Bacteroides pyogenes F0041]|uniref:Uncharacterized protein n=1 Tax=Bacteroides pyogenes F0041 TaxID=1321819 RepID=U2CUZ2_9BACE|nr:hypothetical protein HMPREF1981_00576 [Bacteroides pyogenes F0041]
MVFQRVELTAHPPLQGVKAMFGMFQVDVAQSGTIVEIVHGESVRIPSAIEPDVPQEQRVNDFGITAQIGFEIQNGAVVERGLYADFVQAGGVAMVILDGVRIRLEDIFVPVDFARRMSGLLQQEIIIAVYAGYHAFPQLIGVERIHQHHFLAFRQRSG